MTVSFGLLLTVTWVVLTSRQSSGVPVSEKPDVQYHVLPESSPYNYPVGDPRRCQEQARESNFAMKRLGVLPGMGWDNLQNLEMGAVVSYNYSLCKMTDDGQFLIPDSVVALPIKSSYVGTFAEMIDSYMKITSSTSRSINVNAGLLFRAVAASGSFSYEHQTIKEKQLEDHSVTTRVQLRYHRYDVRLQPDLTLSLSPAFKKRVMSIAAHILLNNTALAAYEGELLVRDFGTHILTSIIAGAGLEKLDFLQSRLLQDGFAGKRDILAAASASFFGMFGMSISYRQTTSETVINSYNGNKTQSYVSTLGGPLLGVDTSLDAWKNGVENNLVAMDRSGDPLYFLITETMFPELPGFVVAALEKVVRNSIETYYEMNTIKGCTKRDSPNFSQSANFEDGSCMAKATNLTFGGVYQTCSKSGQILYTDPCNGMTHTNPSTGSTSCPGGYQAVLLYSGSKRGPQETKTECHRSGWWIFSSVSCETRTYQATAHYKSYWCSANGPVPNNSGQKYGGFYSSQTNNPLTETHACPRQFHPVQILNDVHICVSEIATASNLLPFGGFYSCQKGNPLASTDPYGRSTSSQWPKGCPDGYNQHALTVEQGCAIYYCVQNLPGPVLPAVRRPPFSEIPASVVGEKDSVLMLSLDDQNPVTNEQIEAMAQKDLNNDDDEDGTFSTEAAAGLGVGVTVGAIILLVIITILIVKLRRKKKVKARNSRSVMGSSLSLGSVIVPEDQVKQPTKEGFKFPKLPHVRNVLTLESLEK